MKPKFKKGDKVRTKKNLKVGEVYDGIVFLESMKLSEGTIRVEDTGSQSKQIEENPFYYRECMLTKIK